MMIMTSVPSRCRDDWLDRGGQPEFRRLMPLSSHAADGAVTGRHAMREPHPKVGKERESPADHRPRTLEPSISSGMLASLKQVRSVAGNVHS